MKVLFIHPRDNGIGQISLGISILMSCLKKEGHTIDLFDSTFYEQRDLRVRNEKIGVFKKTNLDDYISYSKNKAENDFLEKINEFKPDLLALTAMTYTFPLGMKFIKFAKENGIDIPLIVGGAHPTVSSDETINHENVDMICVGEGEHAIVELCNVLEKNDKPYNIANIWYKDKDTQKIYKNEIRKLVDLNEIPCPDWSNFDQMHFYKAFVGNVYKTGHFELSRGCPYRCSYCINENLQKLYKNKGKYHREKKVDLVIEQLKYLKNKFELEMFRFWDETFLHKSKEHLQDLCLRYIKEINLPFIISTRPETINENNILLLKKMGCVAISIGIESGSEKIRNEVLNRKMANEKIINAFNLARQNNIRATAFTMIGIPHETREDIFDTINLCKNAKPDTTSPNFLYPYNGTKIKEICIENKMINENKSVDHNLDSILNLSTITKEELKGLQKTFLLYVKAPKVIWGLIKICEKNNYFSNKLFNFLKKIYL